MYCRHRQLDRLYDLKTEIEFIPKTNGKNVQRDGIRVIKSDNELERFVTDGVGVALKKSCLE